MYDSYPCKVDCVLLLLEQERSAVGRRLQPAAAPDDGDGLAGGVIVDHVDAAAGRHRLVLDGDGLASNLHFLLML